MHEQRLKKLRIEIDYILKLLLLVASPYTGLRTKIYDNLKLAKMWLGKCLGELKGTDNPYPESMNPKSLAIEPEADCYGGEVGLTHVSIVESIKYLRGLIEKLIPEWDDLESTNHEWCVLRPLGTFLREAKMRLIESKLWLGVELGAIRDSVNNEIQQDVSKGKIMSAGVDRPAKVETIKDFQGENFGKWPYDFRAGGEGAKR